MKRIEDSLRDLWDNTKHTNIRIIGVQKEEEKKKGSEKIFEEIIVENFPNMRKEIFTQVQEAQRVPDRINPRKNTPRHILIKLTKIKFKEKILKAAREKQKITQKRRKEGIKERKRKKIKGSEEGDQSGPSIKLSALNSSFLSLLPSLLQY